jgi:hypothetical protein
MYTQLTAPLPEANLFHHLTELEIPLPPSLLEAIERLEEQATEQASIWRVLLIALWEFHVDLLLKESSGNVDGVAFRVICSDQ